MNGDERIFVFGSNLAGRHGQGAAYWALKNRGAIYGNGNGLQGQSYAIPTKDESIRTLPIAKIASYGADFLNFARAHSEMTFQVTPIGCGLAGYKPGEIAWMFEGAPSNCDLPPEFVEIFL